ncbi:hypothetical protein F4808DRAFT_65571 [Astrocystis sublimbata]|nr:hypothetical protein F4808DRAFT_65571 [Astrocystis sublimbata]
MSNQWLRAWRCAVQNPRLSARWVPVRSLHTTLPRRWPRDDAPRDDNGARKPDSEATDATGAGKNEQETGTGSGAGAKAGAETETETNANANANPNATEDNFLDGSSAATANGEGSQGRKRPAQGLRSRAQRSRKSELPPVQIPRFLGPVMDRHGDAKTFVKTDSIVYDSDQTTEISRMTDALLRAHPMLGNSPHLFAALSEKDVKEFIDMTAHTRAYDVLRRLGTTVRRLDKLTKRVDLLSFSVYWTTLHSIRDICGSETFSKSLESVPAPSPPDWLSKVFSYHKKPLPFAWFYLYNSGPLHSIMMTNEIMLSRTLFFEPWVVDELIMALKAEFMIRAPENSRLANLRRPAIILNMLDYSGFPITQDVLVHAAEKLGADVLHLKAQDIAYIVGRYIGQDITRTPGDLSALGYRAAELSGRLKSRAPVEEENDESESYEQSFVVLRDDKEPKITKQQSTSMNEFLLGSGMRGKSDELWEDMKVNTALDELIHSADTDATEQKPLIVHIHDFNALNMDETGAAIITKIRKVVDNLWLSGRKVVVVGSCSTNNAPKPYQTALEVLESNERVIHMGKRHFADHDCNVESKATLELWERQGYLHENVENIVRVLHSLTEPGPSQSPISKETLGIESILRMDRLRAVDMGPWSEYCNSILPMTEVYRVATTMISSSSTGEFELNSWLCFLDAATEIDLAKQARERAASRSKASQPSVKGSKQNPVAGSRKTNPNAENHEEKLLSSMVNAKDMHTTFKDIHAPKNTIESIKMLTTLSLIRPEAFSYGVLKSDRIPGCLLYGPPGTGKTLLAKAVAKESGANMIEISGASINNKWVGESEKNVRALFRLAKKQEPMVIFIDEADALLGARGLSQGGGKRETINQFLREWDGMDQTKAFIMVATNRPFDLDEAVLRRLPRKLLIDLPLEPDRAAILKIHLKDETMDETVSIDELAKKTPLYSGSDLKNMCVAAAMAAVKEELEASERHSGPEPYPWAERRVLNRRHFDKALEEIGASVSDDTATLTAIRKFDERYGDKKGRKKRKGMGFEVVPEVPESERARVRTGP